MDFGTKEGVNLWQRRNNFWGGEGGCQSSRCFYAPPPSQQLLLDPMDWGGGFLSGESGANSWQEESRGCLPTGLHVFLTGGGQEVSHLDVRSKRLSMPVGGGKACCWSVPGGYECPPRPADQVPFPLEAEESHPFLCLTLLQRNAGLFMGPLPVRLFSWSSHVFIFLKKHFGSWGRFLMGHMEGVGGEREKETESQSPSRQLKAGD